MGGIDGIRTSQLIREIDASCLLVFSTTSKDHAVRSFRVRAFDYLLKPFGYDQLAEVMTLCNQALKRCSCYIEVKEGRLFKKILINDIIYTDYNNHYIQIHTKDKIIKSYMSFQDFSMLLLPYPQFVSCYRNCMVNMSEIAEMTNKDFIMKNDELVPITRTLKGQIHQQYADFVFKMLREDLRS